MSPEFDAVIVGCGPAGATAGYLLSRAGHSVVMLDKAVFPRPKLCGGTITGKTTALLERVFDVDSEALHTSGLIDYSSDRYEIYVGFTPICSKKTKFPFLFVRREIYDTYFLARAKEEGAEVHDGDACTGYIPARKMVTTASGATYRGRCVIGADGIHSIIRRRFPPEQVSSETWTGKCATALEIYLDRKDLTVYGDLDHPILFYRTVPWGYAWLFPNSDRIIAGIAGLNQKKKGHLKDRFIAFLSGVGLEIGEGKLHGWTFPYGSYLSQPAWDRTLLAGDAGGYADPFFGEGIFFAHRTGELAASAVHRWLAGGPDPGLSYTTAIGTAILPEMEIGEAFRKIFFGTGVFVLPGIGRFCAAYLSPYVIDVIHGRRSYKWFRTRENPGSVNPDQISEK